MEAEKKEKEEMAAVEGEKKGAMEAEKGGKEAMAAKEGAPVEEKGKGEERAVPSEEEKGEAASEEKKGEAASEKWEAVAKAAEAEKAAGMKMITVKSLDGEERSMSVAAAKVLSAVLSGMIEDNCEDNVISLTRVATGRTLDMVVEYCTKHATEPVKSDWASSAAACSSSVDAVYTAASKELTEWDRKLVKGLSAEDLLNLLAAATYLSIDGLLDVLCEKTVADIIKGKTAQEIRDIFNLPYDLTPEDVAGLRQKYAWSYG